MPDQTHAATGNPTYAYVPLVDPGRVAGEVLPARIRILTLFPSEQLEDDLHVSLQIIDISSDTRPKYEALSYVWGGNDKTGHVTIDGHYRLGVTASLDSALRHLRLRKKDRILWADAICINQEADKERSHQVQLMGDVYRGAKQIVVWFGPEADDSTVALRFLQRFASLFTIDWETEKGWPRFRYIDEAKMPATMLSNLDEVQTFEDCGASAAEAQAVWAFSHRPWWERVWIRQEIFLARQAVAQCGSQVAPWDVLKNAIEFLGSTNVGPSPSVSAMSAHEVSLRMRLVWNICKPQVQSVLQVLGSAAISHCQDPRDKIYSMLSLLGCTEDWVGGSIVPDYGGSTTAADVYTDFAWRYTCRARSLNILSQAGPRTDSRLGTLTPSWVPDWTCPKEAFAAMFYARAGTWMEPEVLLVGEKTLRVSGVILPRVARVFTCTPEPQKRDNLLKELQFLRQTFRLLQGQPELAALGVHELLQAYCRAMQLNVFRDSLAARGRMPGGDLFYFDDALQLLSGIIEASEEGLQQIMRAKDEETDRFRWMSVLQTASLAVTEDGRLARVPNSTKAGDVFGVLPSFNNVLLLRPVEAGKDGQHKSDIATYVFVGSSFLDGCMHGEALLGQFPENISVVWKDNVDPAYVDICSGTSTRHDPRLESFDVFEKMDKSKREKLTTRQRYSYVTVDMLKERGVPIQEIDLV